MTVAQAADRPEALARAAWTLGMVHPSAGDVDGALAQATDAAGLLEPMLATGSDDTRAWPVRSLCTRRRRARGRAGKVIRGGTGIWHPSLAYRRVLPELCGRPADDLEFANRPARPNSALRSRSWKVGSGRSGSRACSASTRRPYRDGSWDGCRSRGTGGRPAGSSARPSKSCGRGQLPMKAVIQPRRENLVPVRVVKSGAAGLGAGSR
jgi:hypothetical protein